MRATVADAVMKRWVPELLAAINGDAAPFGFALTEPGRAALTELLEGVIKAGTPGERGPWRELAPQWLPRVGVGVTRGVRTIVVEPPPASPKVPIPAAQLPAPPGYEDALRGVAAALLVHPTGARLRRCDWQACSVFFLARSNHRRAHSFCCDDHRRAYDVAHRDPERVAQYMREWRAVTRKKKRGRKVSGK